MSYQELILILAAMASMSLIAAIYYINKYKRLSGNAVTMCKELMMIRKQLYNESNEEANGYVVNTFTTIKTKNDK